VRGVVVGHPVAERGGAVRGRQPCGRPEQVLESNRHAAQRAGIARAHAVGLGERALGAQRDERVELAVDAVDRIERCLDELARRDLAGADERCLLGRGTLEQLRHGSGGGHAGERRARP
jgi:hypothetical protein